MTGMGTLRGKGGLSPIFGCPPTSHSSFIVHPSSFILLVVLLAGVSLPARAEMDYEFAKLLMDQSVQDFDTDDLVAHLAAQLERSPATRTESKLIKATLDRKQAGTPGVSLDKRKKLLDEADTLFREVAAEKTFRLQSVAEKELATINSARATMMMRNAQELERTNRAEADRMRAEAIATIGKIADGHKAEADALRPKFETIYKAYQEWRKKQKSEDTPIPKEMLDKMMGTFNPWLFADKRYVATKIEQLECYDDKDVNKKKLGEELAKLCEARANQDDIMEFPVLVAWYNYMCGRAWAAVQDEKKAADYWRQALDQPAEDMAPEQKKAIAIIKKLILHDLVTMKMHAKNYGDVENIVLEAKTSAELRSLFDEDAGKELIIDYAKALTLPSEATAAEYEKAVKELREMIAKEGKGGAVTRWANEFSRTIAEILQEARANKSAARPKLSALEWYDAAHGYFLMGQNEYLKYQDFERDRSDKAPAQFEKCYTEYQNGVEYYRRAITAARSEKTDLPTRVEVEPKAWFEMGLAYLKMRHYYEAIIVYQAMRDRYLPEGRKRWLPKLEDPRAVQPRVAKAVQDSLAELDKPREGLLAKAGTNIAYGLEANLKVHNNPKDSWNPRLRIVILGENPSIVDDTSVKDLKYLGAKNDLEEAGRLSKAGTEALRSKPPETKLAEENYTLSATKYASAGDKFMKVDASSQAYELALYKAGNAYTLAQALWVTGKLPAKSAKEAAAAAKDLGVKALAAFDKYDACIAKAAGDDEVKTRRQKLAGMVLLARNALYSGDEQWERVIKSADDYIQWENQNPQQSTSVHVALMNKFHAQIELGAANLAPKCDPYLEGADKTMKAWREIKKTDNKTFVYMLEALARRYNIAAFQVEKFIKEEKKEYTKAMLDAYENRVADLWAERVQMVEEAEGEQQTSLEDYARVVYLFLKAHRNREAADCAKKLLDKFDADGKGTNIPDDEKVWQNMLAKMQQIIRYNDLTKWDRCKKDHMILVDYLYDTREGVAEPDQKKRPAWDQFNMDLEKANKQWETIKNNYPDCQTFDKKYGPEGKSYMEVIAGEIDYRRKIEGARDQLFDKSLLVAEELEKQGDAEGAKRYREIARAQLEIIIRGKGDTPELLVKSARINLALGKYDDARGRVNEAKAQLEENSPTYFDACRLDSEIYRAQKKWKDAKEYPEFYALTIGLDSRIVNDRWPNMKAFLSECYANGVPCPAALKEKLKPGEESAQPGDKKKEETKPEEPKKTEPKADAKAQPVEEKKNE